MRTTEKCKDHMNGFEGCEETLYTNEVTKPGIVCDITVIETICSFHGCIDADI